MLKDLKSLKEFINWCQQNKIKSFKTNDIQFEFTELAFIEDANKYKEIELSDNKTFSDFDDMSEEEKQELLYWSSGNKPQP